MATQPPGDTKLVSLQPYKSPTLRARQLSMQKKATQAKPKEVSDKQPAAHLRSSSRTSAGIKQGFKQSRSRSTKRLSGDLRREANSVKVGQIYTDARRQVARLTRSRSKSGTYRAVAAKGTAVNGKKPVGAAKPK